MYFFGESINVADWRQPRGGSDAMPEAGKAGEGPVFHKTNSRMIMLIGLPGGGLDSQRALCGNYFYEWTGTRLRRLKFVAGKRTDTP